VKVALIQLETILDRTPRHTRLRAAAQVMTAAEDGLGSQLVVLPELWAHGAFDPKPWPELAEPIDGEIATTMRAAAVTNGVVLHAGSIVERAAGGEYYNTSLVYGYDGEDLATYRKIHRFGFDQGEAAFMAPGTDLATFELLDFMTRQPVTTVGLATCYDLRFPELFRAQLDLGATAVVLPSAFTAATGKDHWEPLLRARAIENQVYLMAPAQFGSHSPTRRSYGHALIVDPWGAVLAECGDHEGFALARLDFAYEDKVRAALPSLANRRL
jgi:predicted amidohydrolase